MQLLALIMKRNGAKDRLTMARFGTYIQVVGEEEL